MDSTRLIAILVILLGYFYWLNDRPKSYTNGEMVRKIFRSLPKRWQPKVTAIQEAKDLNTLELDEIGRAHV